MLASLGLLSNTDQILITSCLPAYKHNLHTANQVIKPGHVTIHQNRDCWRCSLTDPEWRS